MIKITNLLYKLDLSGISYYRPQSQMKLKTLPDVRLQPH